VMFASLHTRVLITRTVVCSLIKHLSHVVYVCVSVCFWNESIIFFDAINWLIIVRHILIPTVLLSV
jgi:hypothetical protein